MFLLTLKQYTLNFDILRLDFLVSRTFGWLIGSLFWVEWSSETVFQSISGLLPERGRQEREVIDERKNVPTTPPAPTARAVGSCPTIIQISRTPRHWKFYPAPLHNPTTPCTFGKCTVRNWFLPLVSVLNIQNY